MAYELEFPNITHPLAFDFETIANPAMIDFLPEVTPDSRLKDPDKIKADIEKKKTEQIDKMALNGNTALIVACGFATWDEKKQTLWSDALLLTPGAPEWEFLRGIIDALGMATKYITFNGMEYDVPVLLRRGIACAKSFCFPLGFEISLRKYDIPPRGNHYDLQQIISHNGQMPTGGFDTLCKMILGEGKPEGVDGSKVGEMWKAGKYAEIKEYARRDAYLTYKLWSQAQGIYFKREVE
jgi:3'-5' exonuclease